MGNIIVLAVLGVAVFFVLRGMLRNKRAGKSLSCSGDCKHCSGGCH